MIVLRQISWTLVIVAISVWALPRADAQSEEQPTPATVEPPAQADDEDEDEDDENAGSLVRDGVFKPSEEIEADSEISFPADI